MRRPFQNESKKRQKEADQRHLHLPEDHAGIPALAACTEGCSGPLGDEDGCAALPWYHTRLCLSVLLRNRKGRGWCLSPASTGRGAQGCALQGLCPPFPTLSHTLRHSPCSEGPAAAQSHPPPGSTQQNHQDHKHCCYCSTINKRAENGFSRCVVCYLLKTLLLSSAPVAAVTSPRTHGPQSLRGHPESSAHLHL